MNKKQKIKEHQKQYRKYNPLTEDKKQKIKEYQKQYRENNPLTKHKKQKIKVYQKEYYINNKELILERAKNEYKSLTEDKK